MAVRKAAETGWTRVAFVRLVAIVFASSGLSFSPSSLLNPSTISVAWLARVVQSSFMSTRKSRALGKESSLSSL
eukprot:CAMPEP_0201965900 /NCGR_PEP_ID=MMETSP0904-20121228/11058_1 /ASSEMBLY_ACC=CAM_ASM_000553 /TAXON_ID=420261 /ORGANISM="Thalassiosira antarctica, Strain CCMP982" /LENGTH=73 /DNA_ID=CAMNT_0048513039 /DNA_START=38 /DNA_END=259 /DNA_ORIENTATION=+